jgi:MscS family membrane protein
MAEVALTYQHEMRRLCPLLPKGAARLGVGTGVLSLVVLLSSAAWAQLPPRAPAPAAAQPEVAKDPLGRTTPRGTVLGFLSAARKEDYELAAEYLNTRLRDKAAADLAHELFVVLDRRLPARLNQLSDEPGGSQTDLLKPDQELVGAVSGDNGSVDIVVGRIDRGKSGSLWLFSSKTLESIPDLYDEVNVVSVDAVLPEFLVKTRFAGILAFHWLAVLVGMPLFYLLTTLLNRLLSRAVGMLGRRLYQKADLPNPEVLPKPVRLLLLALVIRWLLTKVSLPLLGRQFWSSIASIMIIAGCVWLLILLNGWLEEYLRPRLQRRKLTGATSMLRLARRVGDVLVVFAGMIVALHHFRVDPTAALAGLGVGGIAVALAAQKTLENVIGGVSLIFDQPVNVGDTLRLGSTVGTVDDFGLRSTRIRTLDRTMVSVPNGQIANMSLENLSARDKFWFHPILSLHYGTTEPQMQAVLDGIRRLLAQTPDVDPQSVRVRFLRFGPSSLDVEVFAYILARDWSHFLEIQERLLLRSMVCIESAGVQIAIPSQSIFLAASSTSTDGRMEGLLKAPALDKKTSDQAAAKSA